MNTGSNHQVTHNPAAQALRLRVQQESRLIHRLMSADDKTLHDECEALHLPHEGRTTGELRAALFTCLRRQSAGSAGSAGH
jgi:hypothetical protein